MTHTKTYTHKHTNTHTHTHGYKHTYTHIHTDIHTHNNTEKTHINTLRQHDTHETYTHKHTYTHTHIHINTYTPSEPPGKPMNTGVGSLALLQGISPTQELKQGLLHCRQILYQLNY